MEPTTHEGTAPKRRKDDAVKLAVDLLEDRDGEATLAELIRRAGRNKDLRDDLLRLGADEALRTARHRMRGSAVQPVANPDNTSGILAMADRRICEMMDYPLPNQDGRKLGDAHLEHIIEAGDYHGGLAHTHGVSRDWFRAIAKAMDGWNGIVRDRFTADELQAMREQVNATN